MKNILIPSLALALAAFGLPSMAQDIQPLDGIAAVVNEDVILESELALATANILSQYGDRPEQLPPAEVLRRQVLERLILVRLQTARAQESGVRVSDEEIDAAIGGIAKQNNLTPDQLRQQLAGDGLSFSDFRRSLGEELMIQRMRQRFAQSRITVSEGEVDAALATQASGTQYRLAHILVALPNGATPEQIATAQQKADGVKGLLDRGEMDFQAAAVRYSDSPNALEGGDLGWRSSDEIPTAFSGSISTMQRGQVLGPFRGPSGFQLLQLVDTRSAAAADAQTVTQYQARHILVRSSDAAGKARIDTLRARIAGGADFATVAREDSEDRFTGDKGGDLGWFMQDQFGPDFGAQVAGLADGEVSAPFRTQAGWHVVQRQGTRQANVGEENRRAQVRETIGQRKLEDEWNRYLRELRGEAYVDIRTAGVSGANGD
ncbi:peptidylprolyl isomerase [Luteimonas sp. MC1572]|uniref:peptidylprolyl isomerase n=1 Tax=Luteimonas sp. MC1572 TaxID=2799325 RepID=UPI0018F0DF5C|nr:peptidylprolyl isomerase [Luteimonas sp. MC1572]MBJ6981272.1 peptidylprolyl isomerase [Luteimonas sp. MC1572]QQO02595.1 peptidylprolyl isomerase [Luteimonas sp. MC1572]